MSDRQYPSKLLDVVVLSGVVLSVGIVGVVVGRDAEDDAVFLSVAGVVGVVVLLSVAGVVGSGLNRERCGSVRSGRERRSIGGSALKWAGRLLPEAIREDYIEEWQAWLSDLHQAGEPWYRRMAELLVIVLVAVPRLAIICRLPRKTVD